MKVRKGANTFPLCLKSLYLYTISSGRSQKANSECEVLVDGPDFRTGDFYILSLGILFETVLSSTN